MIRKGWSEKEYSMLAVVTFDWFNELDSFIASAVINRARPAELTAYITTPTSVVTSMNGVEVVGSVPSASLPRPTLC
jgi:hypothetical protein